MPTAIPDTSLNLPPGELALFRQHHGVALGQTQRTALSHYSHSSTSSRGRGTQRSTPASSRAASAVSSGQGGRIMLDAGSLSVLGAYFDRLMGRIQDRVDYLSTQTTMSSTAQSRSAASTMAGADAEIARFKDILRQIDELETEFDKVRHIRDIVKAFRGRVERAGHSLRR
ncbi:MAG: hypothetical protein MMC23_008139 [Stictis urceolatum]|nr:hypothetical protein [Stictis urceolata]